MTDQTATARRKIRYMSAAEPKVREPQGTIAPAPGAEPEPQNMRIAQGVAQGLPAALAGLAAEGGLAKLAAKWAEVKMKDQAREKIRETYGLPNNRSHAEDLYQKLATLQFLRLDPASQAAFVEYDPTRPDKVPRELRQANGAGTPFKDRYEAMRNYERAVVKNLHPMVGPNGDNETAAQFVNRSIERRNELFGEDIARYGAHAMELVNRASAYVPPAPRVDAPATGSGQGFIARAKEAAGVVRDLAGLAAGGAKKSMDMDAIHAGAANLARPGGKSGIKEIDASLRSIPVVVNGKIDEGGRVRSMTDADRRDLGTFKSQIGYQQDSKGGDAGQGSETAVSETAVADPVPRNGPRIVINPSTFRNRKDALCVAWNERLRIWMEQQDFKPRSEPTPEQRDFFADTPYANDEVQMRRTILARIATLDTSIQEPTREQVSETLAVLQGFGETETPETRREADDLARLTQLVDRTWSYPGSEDDLDDELTETEAEPADRRTEETGDLDDELSGMEPEPGDLDDLGGEMSEHDEDLDNITGEEI